MTTTELPVPRAWDEITGEWMTTALAGHHPGAVVGGVEVVLRDDGTNRRARLGLTYSSGTGPETVFVKGADPAHTELIALTSGLYHEPRLFNSNIELPLEHPTVYASLTDEANDNFVLVMEDLTTRGADPRDATRPMSVVQAASAVRGLARLHGSYWGVRFQRPALSWVEQFVPWSGMEYAPLPAALERLGDTAPPEVQSLSIDHLINGVWKPYIRTLTTSNQTLLHGDAHIGNSYVLPGDKVGFLDWQVVRRGNFGLDLGYFLQGALTIEDRRNHERDLLDEYRGALGLLADELPSRDEVWRQYRASVAHGLAVWLCTASAGELWQRPDIAIALAERYSVAYADLETAQALETFDT